MPVTLSRRIRRIGLLPSTTDAKGNVTRNYDPALSEEDRAKQIADLKAQFKAARVAAFAKQAKQHPAKHRRSKSRRATQKKAA